MEKVKHLFYSCQSCEGILLSRSNQNFDLFRLLSKVRICNLIYSGHWWSPFACEPFLWKHLHFNTALIRFATKVAVKTLRENVFSSGRVEGVWRLEKVVESFKTLWEINLRARSTWKWSLKLSCQPGRYLDKKTSIIQGEKVKYFYKGLAMETCIDSGFGRKV